MSFDREKFKRLVHYVIWKAGSHPNFGATKLNKVLWFAEARTYAVNGTPLTGATYIREKFGPVPREIMPIETELRKEGKIRVIPRRAEFEHTQFQALEPPSDVGLTAEEKQNVDYWIRHIDEEHTATSISELSHDYPWEIAEMGEIIPLYADFANRVRAPKDQELEWARKVAEKLKLP